MCVRLPLVPARILGEVRLDEGISALPIRAVPKLPFVGAHCRSWGGLALLNAVVRQQSWVRMPVIRWMSVQTSLDWIGVDEDDSNPASPIAAVAPRMIGASLHEHVACLQQRLA
jgi:hypothetical protein